jgi:hypothetical protein
MMYQGAFKRYEVKYLLSDFQYVSLRKFLERMTKPDEYGWTQILNIYYDTPSYEIIRRSLDKPVYKEKLRLRSYGIPTDNSNAFIEIKKKYKGVVYKRRVSMPYERAWEFLQSPADTDLSGDPSWSADERQIMREITSFRETYAGLSGAMVISYDRIALAGTDDPDFRVTFDTNIRYRMARGKELDLRDGNGTTALLKKGQHLMELKIAGAMPYELAETMSRLAIFPTSYSKYGMGYKDLMSKKRVFWSAARQNQKIVNHNRNEEREDSLEGIVLC